MKRLIIVRHGNTFTAQQTPTRVGCHTDLPLVETQLGKNIGLYLAKQNIKLDRVFAAPLKRTMQTAQLIINELKQKLTVEPIHDFIEIDYGPDENQIEDNVILRLGKVSLQQQGITNPTTEQIIQAGQAVIEQWNKNAIVPFDWVVDVDKIIHSWQHFANNIPDNQTQLVVSSNGIIRFAPHILTAKNYERFIANESLKVKTGSLCVFEYDQGEWECKKWNQRP
ncbi:histidine phosphatase family protein [Orbaceae bacterium ac157xtp]